MRVKLNSSDGVVELFINGRSVNVGAVAIEAAPGEPAVISMVVNELDFVLEADDANVNIMPPDPRPAMADFIRGLPADMVETAAMAEMGWGTGSVVAQAISIISEIVRNAELGVNDDDAEHDCSDGCGEGLDEGSYFDHPSRSRDGLQ